MCKTNHSSTFEQLESERTYLKGLKVLSGTTGRWCLDLNNVKLLKCFSVIHCVAGKQEYGRQTAVPEGDQGLNVNLNEINSYFHSLKKKNQEKTKVLNE